VAGLHSEGEGLLLYANSSVGTRRIKVAGLHGAGEGLLLLDWFPRNFSSKPGAGLHSAGEGLLRLVLPFGKFAMFSSYFFEWQAGTAGERAGAVGRRHRVGRRRTQKRAQR
jgi:hypothetical protein